MAATSSAFTPTPKQEHTLNNVLIDFTPRVLSSPAAVMLAAAGLESKAWKLEECGVNGRIRTCPNDHYYRTEVGFCGTKRCCNTCAIRFAQGLEDHWSEALDHIANSKEHREFQKCVLLELSIPHEVRSGDHCSSDLDVARSRVESCAVNQPPPMWRYGAGYDGNNFILRILLVGCNEHGPFTVPTEAWCALWPEAKVKVTVDKASNVHYWFHRLVRPLKIVSTEDGVAQEILFHRKQMFRAVNLKNLCLSPKVIERDGETESNVSYEDGEKLFVEEGDTTNNSPQANSTKIKPKYPKCPTCGMDCDRLSLPMRINSPTYLAEMRRLRGDNPPPG